MRVLAIDPGTTESAYAVIDADYCEPKSFDKVPNERLRRLILGGFEDVEADHVAIEQITSYGMAVGQEVLDTCVWIGRFCEAVRGTWAPFTEPELIPRRAVKLHHCKTTTATDANVAQALKSRFAYGVRNHGKGTKDEPGFFYGFHADVWQAFALAVVVSDRLNGGAP